MLLHILSREEPYSPYPSLPEPIRFIGYRGQRGRSGTMATNWGTDLIVIGNRGHTGLKELFLGSVSNYVLHHAPCSVLTVKFSAPVNA